MDSKNHNSPNYRFPNPEHADKQGLLVIGGPLDPPRVIQAYRQGVFPWYESGCPVLWWSPNPRLLLHPNQFNCSRSLKKSLKRPYELRIDSDFKTVIQHCATAKKRQNQTWITSDMIDVYSQLHHQGYAHSFEIWQNEQMIGGLYGLSLGGAFFGESMFHLERDASKIALYELCQFCIKHNFDFIDCQLPNAHLQRLGAKLIDRKEFLHRLKMTLKQQTMQYSWHKDCLLK